MTSEPGHLDAETVAAWLDGGLDAVSLAAAEAHASNCERCRALLATTVRITPAGDGTDVAPGSSRTVSPIWWRWWMAPIAATAAAVTLWMIVPQEQLQQLATAPAAEVAAPADARAPGPQTAGESDRATKPPAGAVVEPKANRPAPLGAPGSVDKLLELRGKADAPAASQETQFSQPKLGGTSSNVADAAARQRQDVKAEARGARLEAEPPREKSVPATPPPAAAPPAETSALRDAPVAQLRKQAVATEVVSPDPLRRWRATADGIEYSEDGGRTWLPVRLAQGEIVTAGASPAPLVCWMVGRGGLVLLATDGTNFTRLPFPEAVDLVAVGSPEIRIAVVTTADGRIFRTENAGRTWNRQ